MPQIGPLEVLTVLVIALIVFGPTKLPEIARNVGKAIAELRNAASDLRSEFEGGLQAEDESVDSDDPQAPVEEELESTERGEHDLTEADAADTAAQVSGGHDDLTPGTEAEAADETPPKVPGSHDDLTPGTEAEAADKAPPKVPGAHGDLISRGTEED
jgi:sec-independent protein translocase protein TatB